LRQMGSDFVPKSVRKILSRHFRQMGFKFFYHTFSFWELFCHQVLPSGMALLLSLNSQLQPGGLLRSLNPKSNYRLVWWRPGPRPTKNYKRYSTIPMSSLSTSLLILNFIFLFPWIDKKCNHTRSSNPSII